MASFSLPLPPPGLRPSHRPISASANPRRTAPPTSPKAGGEAAISRKETGSSDRKQQPWWAPLFSTVLRPDQGLGRDDEAAAAEEPEGREGPGSGDAKRRSPPVLTAEKARVLRREMRATETWHDAMYHSAIASRLASPDERAA